jgi:hypothetical protein
VIGIRYSLLNKNQTRRKWGTFGQGAQIYNSDFEEVDVLKI